MRKGLLLFGLLSAGLVACDDAPPPRPAAATPPPPAAAPTAAATGEGGGAPDDAMGEYVYTPIGKRDPFRSYFQDATVSNVIKPNPKCGPLCRWDLDQLRLVAVVSGVSSPLAMVEAPDSKGYVLRRGSFVGKRQGKVADIRRDMVIVQELIRGQDGVIIPTRTEIRLRSSGGGRPPSDEIVDLMNAEAESGEGTP